MAVAPKQFVLPTPAFGPGSIEHMRQQAEALELDGEVDGTGEKAMGTVDGNKGTYAGAGSYF